MIREFLQIELRPELRRARERLIEPIKAASVDGIVVVAILIDTRDIENNQPSDFVSNAVSLQAMVEAIDFARDRLRRLKEGAEG